MDNLTPLKSIGVFCSSSALLDPKYHVAAKILGAMLAQSQIRLVYGGSRVGLMGTLAESCLNAGGKVLGISTEHLKKYNINKNNLTEIRVVKTMTERKAQLIEESDGFIILPGGFGTLEEVFEVLTWKQIGLHSKPIVIYNMDGYWTPLMKLIYHVAHHKFALSEDKFLLSCVQLIDHVLPALNDEKFTCGNPIIQWYRGKKESFKKHLYFLTKRKS